MSEKKRFELRSYGNDEIWEMKDRQGESLLTWGDIEKKLNQLAEENEQLRRYVYHCPQICNIILAYLRKCESEDVKAVIDAMDDDKYFDDDIDTLRSWE